MHELDSLNLYSAKPNLKSVQGYVLYATRCIHYTVTHPIRGPLVKQIHKTCWANSVILASDLGVEKGIERSEANECKIVERILKRSVVGVLVNELTWLIVCLSRLQKLSIYT